MEIEIAQRPGLLIMKFFHHQQSNLCQIVEEKLEERGLVTNQERVKRRTCSGDSNTIQAAKPVCIQTSKQLFSPTRDVVLDVPLHEVLDYYHIHTLF